MLAKSVAIVWIFGATLVLGLPKKIGFGSPASSIVGGEDVEKGEFPFQVSLQFNDRNGLYHHSCGAAILDATHVLCAGHCLEGADPTRYIVVTGAHNISNVNEPSQQHTQVKEFITHEHYNGDLLLNDIAIGVLESAIVFDSYSQPASLCQQDPAVGEAVVASGWGNAHPQGERPGEYPDILQKVTLEAISRETCALTYPDQIQHYMVCAAGIQENPSGACSRDSGSPLMYKPNGSDHYCVTGITSFAILPCGFDPVGYTSVPYFLDWIAANTQ